jgi:hypothetical protein
VPCSGSCLGFQNEVALGRVCLKLAVCFVFLHNCSSFWESPKYICLLMWLTKCADELRSEWGFCFE